MTRRREEESVSRIACEAFGFPMNGAELGFHPALALGFLVPADPREKEELRGEEWSQSQTEQSTGAFARGESLPSSTLSRDIDASLWTRAAKG